mgnify:FL=1
MITITKTEIKNQSYSERFYMTPEFSAYEDFLIHCKLHFTTKVQTVMDFISLTMKATLLPLKTYDFSDNDIDIFDITSMQVRFKKEIIDGHTFCVATYNGILTFECSDFDFKFKNSYSYFYAVLNESLELATFEYSSLFYDKTELDKSVHLKFDSEAMMTEYSYTVTSSYFGWTIGRFKSKEMLCPYTDELFLHDSVAKRTSLMNELFPELYVIGVYDFSAPEFKRKLTLFQMSLI